MSEPGLSKRIRQNDAGRYAARLPRTSVSSPPSGDSLLLRSISGRGMLASFWPSSYYEASMQILVRSRPDRPSRALAEQLSQTAPVIPALTEADIIPKSQLLQSERLAPIGRARQQDFKTKRWTRFR